MVNLSIIIPIYNGLNNLKPLLDELLKELNYLKLTWEILFIDDHSSDKSFEFLKEINKTDSRIKCLRLKENKGQQNAIFCGLNYSVGQFVITMDDDLQHPIKLIGTLIHKVSEGYDIVYAVNRSENRPKTLSIGTWLNGIFFTIFLHKPMNIEIGSFRIMTKVLVDKIKKTENAFIYISALVFNTNPKVLSIFYIPENNYNKNRSRINLKSRLKLFLRLFINYGPTKKFTKEKGEPFFIERSL